MQRNTTHRGDIGMLRSALLLSGFPECSTELIFNDKHKNFRRLKLWFANPVFNASQKQQRTLEMNLREMFGNRILNMYFIEGFWPRGTNKALCIRLKD